MTIDLDDFGTNHIISDQCQSHDCRAELDKLHYANENFKVTLFTIPAEMTIELADWCEANKAWVELAVHGYKHTSNYECEKMTYEDFAEKMERVEKVWPGLFVKGFKAPGWQISDGVYSWLKDNGWWVADQSYNMNRDVPKPDKIYYNHSGNFFAGDASSLIEEVEAWHGHTWNCVGNGIQETFNQVKSLVETASDFQFVSEVL